LTLFGVAFPAKRKMDGVGICLKEFNEIQDEKAMSQCEKEIKSLASLDHKNIINFISNF
jgi:hypothetical protein